MAEPPGGTPRDGIDDISRRMAELSVAEEGLREQNEDLIAARTAVEAENRRYREFLEFAPDGYLVTDLSGTILECNRAGAQLLGVAAGRIAGKPLALFVPDDDVGAFRRLLADLETSEGVSSHELRLRPRDGAAFPALVDVALAYDPRSERRLRWLVRDQSARKRIERDLLESEARLAAVVETAPDGIVSIDTTCRVLAFNAAAERMFGYDSEEVVGRNVRMLMPPPYRDEHDGYVERHLRTGEARIIGVGREVVGQRKDGKTFPIEIAIGRFESATGPVFTAILRDITERRLLEEELLHAQKMEAVGRLAGGIAHDFNNLLAGILGCCRLAERNLEDGRDVHELLDDIASAAEGGTALTRQLLSLGKKEKPRLRPVSLNAVVRAARKTLPRLCAEDVVVETSEAPSGGTIRADPGRIDQVLMNLTVNARDAMPHGGRLSIAVEDVDADALPPAVTAGGDEPAPHVALVVRDTGVGMTPEVRERAFEPFFSTKKEGSGLGLASVYGIVQQFGGSVTVDSAPGEGTTFRVYFPRADGIPDENGERPRRPRPVEPPPDARKGTVLLVEDQKLVRAGVRHLIAEWGYTVLEAADGAEALAVLEQHGRPVDLLLTDVVMPGMSGPELACAVRSVHPRTNVVYMSAFSKDVLVEQQRVPADAFTVEKPFADDELARVLREAATASG